MKTKSVKAGLTLGVILSHFLFCAYAPLKTDLTRRAFTTNWEEYNKVREYVVKNICKPLRESYKIDEGGDPRKYFSRCSSGYGAQITTATDSVKTEDFVIGKIVFNSGCVPKYLCDFKVCVSKGFAMVKSKGSSEYVSVDAWIKSRKEQQKSHEKEKSAKEIVKS